MEIKPGVRMAGIRPEMVLGLVIADAVFGEHDYKMVVTCVVDSKHGRGSLHFVGAAADLRTRHLQANRVSPIVTDMKLALGDDFDVVLEKDHIHFEFQPKRGINL